MASRTAWREEKRRSPMKRKQPWQQERHSPLASCLNQPGHWPAEQRPSLRFHPYLWLSKQLRVPTLLAYPHLPETSSPSSGLVVQGFSGPWQETLSSQDKAGIQCCMFRQDAPKGDCTTAAQGTVPSKGRVGNVCFQQGL